MNFCSAENYTTSLHKQGRDLFVHSLFHIFLEKRRFWPKKKKFSLSLLSAWASCRPRDDELSFSAQGRRDDEAGEKSLRGRGVSEHERKPLAVAMCEFIC